MVFVFLGEERGASSWSCFKVWWAVLNWLKLEVMGDTLFYLGMKSGTFFPVGQPHKIGDFPLKLETSGHHII